MCKRMISFALVAVMVCMAALGNVSVVDAKKAAKKAVISTKKISVKVGGKKTIKISNKRKKAKYKFQSSSKSIATVNAKGVVKGKKAGNAKITVKEKLNGKTRTLGKVTVKVSKKKNTNTQAAKAPAQTQTPIRTQAPSGDNNSAQPTPEATGVNLVKGWAPFNKYEVPALDSIEDASVSQKTKFTHQEWMGIDYSDTQGNKVNGADVFKINRKDLSVTSTSEVSYASVENAIVGARDYKKEKSKYVQFLTGKEDNVTDWSLAVVRNHTEAQKSDYEGFYMPDYTLKGDWAEGLTLPASWTHYGFDFSIYTNVDMPWQSEKNIKSPKCAVEYNPVGMYRKNFKVDRGLVDSRGRINISFQGVESCYYVYING